MARQIEKPRPARENPIPNAEVVQTSAKLDRYPTRALQAFLAILRVLQEWDIEFGSSQSLSPSRSEQGNY